MNLLNINEVSKQTGLNEDELRDLIFKGIFPDFTFKVEKQKRWSQDEVRVWLKLNRMAREN